MNMKRSQFLSAFISAHYRDRHYPPLDGPSRPFNYFANSSLEDARSYWKKTLSLIQKGLAPPDIMLYIHWPFCSSLCSFCRFGMEMPKRAQEMKWALEALKKEMFAFQDLFRDISFASLYVGGGTPTLMTEPMLEDFMSSVRRAFNITSGAQIHFDASPATLTEEKLETLLRYGLNRVTLGIQTFDGNLLESVNRKGQTRDKVRNLFSLFSQIPNLFTDVDLMVGLEGQTAKIFYGDLIEVLRLRPHCLHIYPFDEDPRTQFKKEGKSLNDRNKLMVNELIDSARRVVVKAGYSTAYEDWVNLTVNELETRQEALWRNSRASILGIGYGALSHAFGSAWYYHPKPEFKGVTNADIPRLYAFESDIEEEARGYAVEYLSRDSKMSRVAFRKIFQTDIREFEGLSGAIAELEADGLISVSDNAILWIGRDLVEKSLGLKKLCSQKLLKAISDSEREKIDAFNVEAENNASDWKKIIENKQSHMDCFIYYDRLSQKSEKVLCL